ncbi:MAG TPA: fumarylacetoacetate hydrolase family protein [Elusimicrobiota bacterium]|nr:fumarylacetoacetate hydrolase family protein [Elusimicrobiota bacterium]
MIFCRFQTGRAVRWGRVSRGTVEELLPDPFGDSSPTGLVWPLKDVQLLAPCEPTKIIAIGLNYADHAREFGHKIPKEPLIFLKPASAVIGPDEPIRLPAASRQVEYEAELAVVIGRRARNVPLEGTKKYILGYTLMNDVTARDLQRSDGQWTRAKGFDTFAPLGPWIVSGISPEDLKIEAYVNGERRQSSRTSQLIFGVSRLVSHISQVMTLEPGDIISTGTPSGVGPLKRGDRVEIRVEKIGSLLNRVV